MFHLNFLLILVVENFSKLCLFAEFYHLSKLKKVDYLYITIADNLKFADCLSPISYPYGTFKNPLKNHENFGGYKHFKYLN